MNLSNIFKKNKTQPAPVVTSPETKHNIASNHHSKKKKNTYTITFNVFTQLELFELCSSTPMPVISLNGKPQDTNGTGFISSKEFPNPCASTMVKERKLLADILGPKISHQIIEYLDKDTGQPIVQVYPDIVYIFDKYEQDYLTRLNHATRQDLQYQIALRRNLINEYMKRRQLQK